MNGTGDRTTRSAFCRRTIFSANREDRSSTSATDVNPEHTRERLVTPRADVLSADV
jgi:hypothetical protein